jgi:myosin heavy subunit
MFSWGKKGKSGAADTADTNTLHVGGAARQQQADDVHPPEIESSVNEEPVDDAAPHVPRRASREKLTSPLADSSSSPRPRKASRRDLESKLEELQRNYDQLQKKYEQLMDLNKLAEESQQMLENEVAALTVQLNKALEDEEGLRSKLKGHEQDLLNAHEAQEETAKKLEQITQAYLDAKKAAKQLAETKLDLAKAEAAKDDAEKKCKALQEEVAKLKNRLAAKRSGGLPKISEEVVRFASLMCGDDVACQLQAPASVMQRMAKPARIALTGLKTPTLNRKALQARPTCKIANATPVLFHDGFESSRVLPTCEATRARARGRDHDYLLQPVHVSEAFHPV